MISAQSVTAALRDLYELMDKGFSVPPIMLLQFLQMAFPRFADKNENGTFVQQVNIFCNILRKSPFIDDRSPLENFGMKEVHVLD